MYNETYAILALNASFEAVRLLKQLKEKQLSLEDYNLINNNYTSIIQIRVSEIIHYENIQEEIYHYQEELDNLNSK